jgi:hypothetical protein
MIAMVVILSVYAFLGPIFYSLLVSAGHADEMTGRK